MNCCDTVHGNKSPAALLPLPILPHTVAEDKAPSIATCITARIYIQYILSRKFPRIRNRKNLLLSLQNVQAKKKADLWKLRLRLVNWSHQNKQVMCWSIRQHL